MMQKIEYLGFKVKVEGISPGKRKLTTVLQNAPPTDVRGVRSFIGLSSYFRRFIKKLAIIARPLTDLLSKGAKLHWDVAQDESF